MKWPKINNSGKTIGRSNTIDIGERKNIETALKQNLPKWRKNILQVGGEITRTNEEVDVKETK